MRILSFMESFYDVSKPFSVRVGRVLGHFCTPVIPINFLEMKLDSVYAA